VDTVILPVASTPGFGRFARAFVSGVRLEWLGTVADRHSEGWSMAASAWSVEFPFEQVNWHGRALRVPPLALQRRIEVARDRADRVAAIDRFAAGAR
jgi:hypothetical protein